MVKESTGKGRNWGGKGKNGGRVHFFWCKKDVWSVGGCEGSNFDGGKGWKPGESLEKLRLCDRAKALPVGHRLGKARAFGRTKRSKGGSVRPDG